MGRTTSIRIVRDASPPAQKRYLRTVPVPPILGEGLVERRLRLRDEDVVWLRGILEGYDGLASLFGEGDGEIVLAIPAGREAELDALLADLADENRFLTPRR